MSDLPLSYNPADRLAAVLDGFRRTMAANVTAIDVWSGSLKATGPDLGRALANIQILSLETRVIFDATQPNADALHPALDRIDSLLLQNPETKSRTYWTFIGDDTVSMLRLASDTIDRCDDLKLVVRSPADVRAHLWQIVEDV